EPGAAARYPGWGRSAISATWRCEAGSSRETLPDLCETQRAPPPKLTPSGRCAVTRIFATTRPEAGSTRATVFSDQFATQTEPAPKATPIGPRPVLIRAVIRFVRASMRSTPPKSKLAVQAAPAP